MKAFILKILISFVQSLFGLFYNSLVYAVVAFLFLRRILGLAPAVETRQLWRQRLGYLPPMPQRGIWLHCASLGEATAITPLVRELKEKLPEKQFIISIMNSADMQAISSLYEGDLVVLFPFDTPRFVARALDRVHPAMFVVAEIELWPNFLSACARRSIPAHLVNARVSKKSFACYRLIPKYWIRRVFSGYRSIQAREKIDMERFIQVGVDPDLVGVTGHLRWNYIPPPELIKSGRTIAGQLCRPVWVAASVHPQEMKSILNMHQYLRLHLRDVLLILVPRYPKLDQATMERDLRARGLNYIEVNESDDINGNIDQWLKEESSILWVCRTGEMIRWLSLADMALIGGSLNRFGGHNPIEAALSDCAIFSGTHVENFAEIYKSLTQYQACVMHHDATVLGEFMLRTFMDTQAKDTLCRNALECVRSQRVRVDAVVEQMLNSSEK